MCTCFGLRRAWCIYFISSCRKLHAYIYLQRSHQISTVVGTNFISFYNRIYWLKILIVFFSGIGIISIPQQHNIGIRSRTWRFDRMRFAVCIHTHVLYMYIYKSTEMDYLLSFPDRLMDQCCTAAETLVKIKKPVCWRL